MLKLFLGCTRAQQKKARRARPGSNGDSEPCVATLGRTRCRCCKRPPPRQRRRRRRHSAAAEAAASCSSRPRDIDSGRIIAPSGTRDEHLRRGLPELDFYDGLSGPLEPSIRDDLIPRQLNAVSPPRRGRARRRSRPLHKGCARRVREACPLQSLLRLRAGRDDRAESSRGSCRALAPAVPASGGAHLAEPSPICPSVWGTATV
ncbi:hypothetical protein MTO96_011819 [Rhipicephalus appendiculatus]